MATDEELREIGGEAWNEADRNGEDPWAAERRALYEAGDKNGYQRGRDDADRLWRVAVDWLLTDEARNLVSKLIKIPHWDESPDPDEYASGVLKALHDRITGGGQ